MITKDQKIMITITIIYDYLKSVIDYDYPTPA